MVKQRHGESSRRCLGPNELLMHVDEHHVIFNVNLGMLVKDPTTWHLAVVKAAYLSSRWPDHASSILSLETAAFTCVINGLNALSLNVVLDALKLSLCHGDHVDPTAVPAHEAIGERIEVFA